MPYDEDTKVFDVARPSKAYPDATSKPVIVGHRPQTSDPMVKEEASAPSAPSTPIHVSLADEEPEDIMTHPAEADTASIEPESAGSFEQHFAEPENSAHEGDVPLVEHGEPEAKEPSPDTAPAPEHPEEPVEHSEDTAGSFTSLHTLLPEESDNPAHRQEGANHDMHQPAHDDGWHETPPLPITRGAGPKRRWPKILGLIILLACLVLVAGYLAIDAGLVKSDVKLPFHIFNKQKTSISTAPPPTPAPVTNNSASAPGPSVPNGFTAYKLTGTNISFAYPTEWGTPAVSNDPGYNERGGKAAKLSEGPHAYLVSFASNKDVQITVTDNRYLPVKRTATYYDYLQWCIGTYDKKLYAQSLHTTTYPDGSEVPSNLLCDQGPLTDAAKINDTTIVQLKTKDTDGKTILGDLYTKNLTDPRLSVLRAKDATGKNAEKIKELLLTVQVSSNSSDTITP